MKIKKKKQTIKTFDDFETAFYTQLFMLFASCQHNCFFRILPCFLDNLGKKKEKCETEAMSSDWSYLLRAKLAVAKNIFRQREINYL